MRLSGHRTFRGRAVKLIVLVLLVGVAGLARTPVQGSEPPFTTTGAFFAVSVADIETSSKWYQEKLGLKVILQPPGTSEARAVVLQGGGLTVELMQHSRARPLRTAAPGVNANYEVHGIFKAGVVVDNFDRTLTALRARGVEIAMGPFPKSATQPANVIVKDNAGNYLQFFGK